MDSQRHDLYKSQFRAMFVQSVAIDWSRVGRVDEGGGPMAYTDSIDPTKPTRTVEVEGKVHDAYYSTRCGSCGTEVAVLNMREEVYHFFDCLESA